MFPMRARAWVLGAFCGIAWWGISLLLGARAYGIVGAHPATGALSGVLTGLAITALSLPFYRLPRRALLWYSPVSVYVAVALYGLIVFAIRQPVGDFDPQQRAWAVGLKSITGMWWGITMQTPIVILVHATAYASHAALRRMLVASSRYATASSGSSAP